MVRNYIYMPIDKKEPPSGKKVNFKKRERPYRKQPLWTADEIRILKLVYSTEGLKPVMKYLPRRTYNAIERKVHALGLKRI